MSAIEKVVAQGIPEPMVFGDVGIAEMLKRMNKTQSTDNLIHLLVHTRGALHHYAGTKSRTGASPLTNERYFSLAQFSMRVSRIALESELMKMDVRLTGTGLSSAAPPV